MKALITWASSWLGAEFAKQLAQKWYDLILVARREEKMIELWEELKSEFGINYEVYGADLWTKEWIKQICQEIIEKKEIDLLVNNAWTGNPKWLLKASDETIEWVMNLNMNAVVFLSKSYINKLIENNKNWKIINVASTASFLFDWTFQLYSASKAFVRSISYWFDSAIEEAGFKDKIHIQCLCPSFIKTPFAGLNKVLTEQQLEEMWFLEPSFVVKESLDALEKNELIVLPWNSSKKNIEDFKVLSTEELRKTNRWFVQATWINF